MDQKKFFLKNFHGDYQEDFINNLIKLYKELDMPKLYEETYRTIQTEILEDTKKLPEDVIPHELVFNLLDIIQQKNW